MIRTIIIGIVFLAFMGLTYPVNANWLSDIRDAIAGHIDDLEGRINHEDIHIEGMVDSTGKFRSDDIGRDRIHWADGTVFVIIDSEGRRYIQLDSDFKSGPAPDLFLYVAKEKVFDEISFWEARATEIGKLQSGHGGQFYEVPDGEEFSEVIIWCKRFGEFIGAATLK